MLTYLITGITVVVSFICFNNRLLFDKLSLKPYRIVHAKEWYRIISHGFVHADWVHLFVNMFTFWSFGKYIEETFRYLGFGEGAFLLLYFGGMVVASASDVIRYRNAVVGLDVKALLLQREVLLEVADAKQHLLPLVI